MFLTPNQHCLSVIRKIPSDIAGEEMTHLTYLKSNEIPNQDDNLIDKKNR